MSSVTRLSFTLADQGKAIEPFKKQLPLLGTGAYFISISLAANKGAHMLAMLKADADLVLFDPNIGLFAVGGRTLNSFRHCSLPHIKPAATIWTIG